MQRLRIAVVAAAIALTLTMAAPAGAGPIPHWRRSTGHQVHLLLDRDGSVSNDRWGVIQNRARWVEDHSGSFEFHAVASCRLDRDQYCVRVRASNHANGLAGYTRVRYDPASGHIFSAILTLNEHYMTTRGYLYKIACHELGHVIGAEHRGGGATCMRPDRSEYTELDGGDLAWSDRIHHAH